MTSQDTPHVSQAYSHYGPVPGTVYQLPPPPVGSFPPPPLRQLDVSQATGYRNQQDDLSAMTNNARGHAHGSLMGGRNEQADIRSRNTNNRGISNVIMKRRVGHARAMLEPDPNTRAQNEADTNANTCCLGHNFIHLHYTNWSADIYPYNDAYAPIENVTIVTAATAFNHSDGKIYILVFHESLYYGTKMKHSLINPNQV